MGRSPSYPAVNLETAIRRARELYERERQHPTAVETIVQHWGYKSMNGPASTTLASLKKFGLLTDEGKGTDRRGRLTHLAVDIMANPNAAERVAAIKTAALTPSMHREMWEKYQNSPPSDANLRWDLVRQRGFTESGADDFIRQYKQTVNFAQLDSADHATSSIVDEVDDVPGDDEPDPPAARKRAAAPKDDDFDEGGTSYRIPIFNNKSIIVHGQFPLSEEDWAQFMMVLGAYKAALVIRPE